MSAMLDNKKHVKLLYDSQLLRPGCVLLAAVYGADRSIVSKFDSQDWLVAPTPNLRLYSVPLSEIPNIVAMTKAHRKHPTDSVSGASQSAAPAWGKRPPQGVSSVYDSPAGQSAPPALSEG